LDRGRFVADMIDSLGDSAYIAESKLVRHRQFDARLLSATLTRAALKTVVRVTAATSPSDRDVL
jgi:hypothetical protein